MKRNIVDKHGNSIQNGDKVVFVPREDENVDVLAVWEVISTKYGIKCRNLNDTDVETIAFPSDIAKL